MTDIIIIGGGIAGLTSAVYALRSGKSVLLFEKKAYGGQISQSHAVENYPGFKNISGAELSMNLHAQAKDFGCEFKNEIVTKVIDGEIKKVITNKGEYEAKAVIFAMGAEPRKSGLENEQSLIGRGLSYCAVCDGNFFRNRETMVVGGGSTAVQDALYLAEICKKVYLVHRRD
ncbi:MAG: FAD-dependent oxidoreductase, partial [Clostridia bacterium]|nr:FAD-dependent oxidoreductase [Clostridia bacterium]